VYTNSVLGNLNDLLVGMTDGTIELMYNTLSCYPWIAGADAFAAVFMPFMWEDFAELKNFLDSDLVKGWYEEAAEKSRVRVLISNGELPPRQLTANRAVRNADDFRGLRVRTAEAPVVQETMRRLDAIPVVIPFADLYMALRQRTADAQENNFITAMTSSFYEVQSHFMATDYSRDISAIFISEDLWQQFSDEQRKVLSDAALKATNHEGVLVAELINETIEFLKARMTYVDIDVASIREKLGDGFYLDLDKAGLWPEGTTQKILDWKQNNR
jgi:TRAP-type C4-dicarboxylate transport system substrate-binding protein